MKSDVLYVIHDIPNLPDAPDLEPFVGTYYYDTINDEHYSSWKASS